MSGSGKTVLAEDWSNEKEEGRRYNDRPLCPQHWTLNCPGHSLASDPGESESSETPKVPAKQGK